MKLRKQPRVVVSIPLSWHYVPRSFFLNCIGMMEIAQKSGIKLIFNTNNGCYMDQARDNLVKQALECDPHYILWLDADQLYPNDTPERLMRHMDNNHLVVGGATPKRSNGFPLIFDFQYPDGNFKCVHKWRPLNQGLLEVDAMGFGGIMTHPKVFEKIPPPRFKMWYSEHEKDYVGEDVQFFKLCKEHGIKVWCDTDLTYGHLETKPVLFNTKWKKEVGNGYY